MDAPEDELDIKLQKISGDLIADFNKSLLPFLRKQDGAGKSPVRSHVRTREATRLTASVSSRAVFCDKLAANNREAS